MSEQFFDQKQDRRGKIFPPRPVALFFYLREIELIAGFTTAAAEVSSNFVVKGSFRGLPPGAAQQGEAGASSKIPAKPGPTD